MNEFNPAQEAAIIAMTANQCCHRIDGYEEELASHVLAALARAHTAGANAIIGRVTKGRSFFIDQRLARARSLTAHIMHHISKHLPEYHEFDVRRRVSNEILALLHSVGVEVLTDFDRAELGLSVRGSEGWTIEEIQARDRILLEKMLSPILVQRELMK